MRTTPEQIKDLIIALNSQHPVQWTKGATYDAINPITKQVVKIRRSTAVRTGIKFLHIYVSSHHYRANLNTYTIEEV